MATHGGAQENPCEHPLPNIVPSILVSPIQGTEPQDMALRDCNNNMWQLKIEKFGDDWYFTDGWVKFVEDNMIKGGDVLFYQYSSQGLLDFKILGPSRREDDGVERPETKAIEWHNEKIEVKVEDEGAADDIDMNPPKERDDHLQKEKAVDAGTSVIVRGKGKRRRRKQDYYGTEVFASGEVQQPKNPYFVAQARETRVNEMYIPIDMVRCYKLDFPNIMTITDLEGRTFQTTRTSWKDGRVIYRGGWRALCRVNLAGKEDKLICEFIRGKEGELVLQVSFYRAKLGR